MLTLYRLIFFIIIVIGSPYLWLKALFGHHGVTERLGFVPVRATKGRLFWFHAASIGELKILSSVIPEILKSIPTLEIAVSTTTATGRRRARELFGDKAIIFLAPLEINSAILRTIENIRPEKLILVETEIWPLLITTAHERGVEINLINARMSAKSFGAYRWFKPFMGKVLRNIKLILAQTEEDASRFERLGAPRPQVLGNVKFDQVLTAEKNGGPAFALPDSNRLIFVAGSIRKGEDTLFADLIAGSRERELPVFFVLVPRHMSEVGELCALLENRNIRYALWSNIKDQEIDPELVLVVNTMGELLSFYQAADLTFVGGSLVPIGGHDPAEPAALGKPVLFGPHMENAQVAADLLVKSGGAKIVSGAADILQALSESLADRNALTEKGRLGREAILSRAGISEKIVQLIAGAKQ